MKIHEEILNTIDELTEKQARLKDVKRACFQVINENFPKEEYINTPTLSKLFERHPDYISKLLKQKADIRTKYEGRRKFYLAVDVKKVYLMHVSAIPLYLFAKFLAGRKLVNSSTFYARFVSNYTEYYQQYFRRCKNFFGERALPIGSVRSFFCKLRTEKYIREHWYTIEDVMEVKGVSDRQVCQWICTKQIRRVERLYTKHFIPPSEYQRIVSSKSVKEVSAIIGVSRQSIHYAKKAGKVNSIGGKAYTLFMSEDDIQNLLQKMEADEVFTLIKKKKFRQELEKTLVRKRKYYEHKFQKLRSRTFDELSLREQNDIMLAAKIRVEGSVEYLLDFFDKRARSMAAYWKLRVKTVSFDELYHLAKIGLLMAIERYTYHNAITAYVHVNMVWEIKKHIFSLWNEHKLRSSIAVENLEARTL